MCIFNAMCATIYWLFGETWNDSAEWSVFLNGVNFFCYQLNIHLYWHGLKSKLQIVIENSEVHLQYTLECNLNG